MKLSVLMRSYNEVVKGSSPVPPAGICIVCGDAGPHPEIYQRWNHVLVRCRTCALVFQHPQPSIGELEATHYNDPGFTDLLFGSLRAQTVALAKQRLELLQHLEVDKGPGRALDVGCSSGAWIELLAGRGWEPVGIEIGEATSSRARERLGLDVRTGTLETVSPSLQPGSFDMVTFWDVLEHVPNPLSNLRLARTLLNPDGVLAITCPNIGGWFPRLSYHLFARTTGVWEYPELPVHLYDFEPATLTRLLQQSGFEDVRTVTFNTDFSHFAGTTLSPEALGRGPRASALKAAYRALRLVVYPLARAADRGNSMMVVARKSAALSSPAS